jgi:hypothetical protein
VTAPLKAPEPVEAAVGVGVKPLESEARKKRGCLGWVSM